MMELHKTLDVIFNDASVGINSSKRKDGIRLLPYCEIRHKDIQYLAEIKSRSLNLSVSCTVRKGFLRIQGIQNCLLITQYIEVEWWLKAMKMFEEGKHLTEEGLIEIAKLRDEHTSKKNILTRRDVGDVARILAEN